MSEIVAIDRLGHRGDGLAETAAGPLFVAHALPGEIVKVERTGVDRARLVQIIQPSTERARAFVPDAPVCGGCGLSHMSVGAQLAWKRDLVAQALRHEGIDADIGMCLDAHGGGRRRATFHVQWGSTGPLVGFMEARSHNLVDLGEHECATLVSELQAAVGSVRTIAARALHGRTSMDALVTLTDFGLDIDLRGLGRIDRETRSALVGIAGDAGIARLSLHGEVLVEIRPPTISMGQARIHLPPGAFLQATTTGESALAELVLDGVGTVGRVADLFSGVGTFALRLAAFASVHAVESERPALEALLVAARGAPGLRPISGEARDLMRRPLDMSELPHFEAVVFDPPRAGAEAQARMLAGSTVPRLVAVSCNPATLGRDLRILVEGGYRIDRITPVDQFRHSAHVEAVAVLRKERARPVKRRGRLQ